MDSANIPFPLSDAIDLIDAPQDRLPGYHVTDLIRAAITLSKGDTPRKSGPLVDDTGMMSLGRMWEAVIRPYCKMYCEGLGLVYQAPEPSNDMLRAERDGILANLDGLALNTDTPIAVIEAKLTTSKNNSDPTQYYNWMAQGKAYCHMMGVRQAWFPLCYLPRSGPPMAITKVWLISFEQHEIEENWQMLRNTKEYLIREGIEL